jgi:RHS repeat-associated protein
MASSTTCRAVTLTYDLQHLGNIKSKSDVGTYSYNSSRPHAVTAAGGASYTYDANGNNTGGDGRTIKYRTFDKPWEITKGGHKTTFAYDIDRARYLRVDDGSGGVTTTRYIGNVEIIDLPNGTQQRKRYIAGIAVETRTLSGGVQTGKSTHYIHRDHLGSVDVITDQSGAILQEMSFDAWGQRRNAITWAPLASTALTTFDHSRTTRGFTGHEMLDEVGIIHMNGRIYDPRLGRFLQADPVVQDPTNSQSLNRYSYVWNNPLNATDPSGYFVFTLVAAVALAGAKLTVAELAFTFAFTGFVDALVAGGGFREALLSGIASGISAGAFSGIGSTLSGQFGGDFAAGLTGLGFSIKIVSHGVIGGIVSVIQDGKFGHGFASASFAAAATTFNNSQHVGGSGFSRARVVIAAVVGGTASELSGGKFSNGAITGAFSQALNHELHTEMETDERGVEAHDSRASKADDQHVTLVCRPVSSSGFDHCGTFVHYGSDPSSAMIRAQFSLTLNETKFLPQSSTHDTYTTDQEAFRNPKSPSVSHYPIAVPKGQSNSSFANSVVAHGLKYESKAGYKPLRGPNSNSAASYPILAAGGKLPIPHRPTPALHYYYDRRNK